MVSWKNKIIVQFAFKERLMHSCLVCIGSIFVAICTGHERQGIVLYAGPTTLAILLYIVNNAETDLPPFPLKACQF